MKNPTRRNRNIGTAKQGYGQNNKLCIPRPFYNMKAFYERIGKYTKEERVINGHTFTFILEENRKGTNHACSVADVVRMIAYIAPEDYGRIKWIIFRQPKRKEEVMSPVWGRLIYSYQFENDYNPAIIIEAFDCSRKLKWHGKLSVESQKEMERLKEDGHPLKKEGAFFLAEISLANIRTTQLYRTLLHEFGHYVHYLEVVERPAIEGEPYGNWEERDDSYFRISKEQKERFAHKYADNLNAKLRNEGVIPFATL